MGRDVILLRAFAVLIGLRAVTNLLKPFGAGTGLVFFGKLLTGLPGFVLGPLVGLYMLALAYGIWKLRRFALPMAVAYAVYVTVNLFLFPVFQSLPARVTPLYGLLYVAVALGVTWGAVGLLRRRRSALH